MGAQCSSFLNKDMVEACTRDKIDLTRGELDLVVLAQIRAHRTDDKQPTLHTSHHTTGGFRSQSLFFIKGVQVCCTTFLFLHCMLKVRYNNLVRHFEQHGMSAQQRGNLKCLPANDFIHEDTTLAITFIRAH